MRIIYIDADACPVKDEVYRVAKRYSMRVIVVANATMRIPVDPLVSITVCTGFGGVDDWIAEQCGPGDIVVTADVPLAARAIAKLAAVIDTKGRQLTDNDIGPVLASRDLMEHLRQSGTITGGPAPMTSRDRSKFLSKLDEMINAVLRTYPADA